MPGPTSSRDTAPVQPPGEAPVPARRSPRAWIILLTAVLLGLAADLASKEWAFAALIDRPHRPVILISDLLDLELRTNPGIVFGLDMPRLLVTAATLLAMCTVLLIFASSPAKRWGLHLGLGMVLAGSLGNAYDRAFSFVRFPGEAEAHVGEVRDFIHLHLGKLLDWPVFNIADALLVVGVGLIMLYVLRNPDGHKRTRQHAG